MLPRFYLQRELLGLYQHRRLCMTIPEEIDEHDDIDICYDWHPWDLGDSRYDNIYIRVVHRNPDGGLLTSVEFNHAHVILKKHGVSSRYGYPR